MVMGNCPATVGVPASVAVPLPLSVSLTPLGNGPLSLSAGVGTPVAVTLKELGVPTVNVTLPELVIEGGTSIEMPAENSEVLKTLLAPAWDDGSAVRLVAVAVTICPG